MLAELYIRHFAIIDELRMKMMPGFNVLTGETGAGKSIILDAVMLVLGGRADTNMVRAGAETAYVEATFVLTPALQTAVLPLLEAEGLEDEAGQELLLARELRLSGRNICRINGRAVGLSLLRDVAEPLIDIHGQGDHLSLLKPRAHLPLLDSYARLEKERSLVTSGSGRLGSRAKKNWRRCAKTNGCGRSAATCSPSKSRKSPPPTSRWAKKKTCAPSACAWATANTSRATPPKP
ncbi:MAG: AAA family ATPase [Chloroflexi bacterium]|nr:AAA family ATPase [Chloroflexota bacterium]